MKAATVKEIKTELSQRSPKELMEICLRLSKFKKENKELLSYLLFESDNEAAYIQSIKQETDELFKNINRKSFYYIKKSVRKILANLKKYIRYSKKKETEVELLLYFCSQLKSNITGYRRSIQLKNLYNRQIDSIIKTISTLHEDLRYDFNEELEDLMN